MHKQKGIKKWCILMMMTLSVITSWAQSGTNYPNGINSPFSQYGLGWSNMPYNLPSATALGGVVYTTANSNTVNPFNPASYGVVNMESFVFDMGLSVEMSTLRNSSKSQFDADGNLGYITLAFPLTKWWKTALGIMPYSDIDYQSVYPSQGPMGEEVKTIYEGQGGVTTLFWGNGFNIIGANNPQGVQLRAGFNANYLYGTLVRAITKDFSANDTNYFLDSRNQKNTYIKNFTLDFGLQYEQPLGENYRLGAALTLKPGRTMTVKDNALVYTYVTNAGNEWMRDTIFPANGESSEYESTLEQPFTTGIGLSLQRNDKWLVAFDATFSPWSGMKYTENPNVNIFGVSPLRYGNNSRFALGFQLLGNKNASSYLRRITYSIGGHYESGRLQLQVINNSSRQLNEWGCGFGVALPMRKGRSVVNIGVGYSSLGTTDLLRRDAFTIGISIGSCESWFVKRKFN